MKLLPKGITSFEKMVVDNYAYVDKTKYIYDIIANGTYYFLSRPRRFGKSLLISTFNQLFSGNRELFKGLWIDKSDFVWKKYPIINLSFASVASNTSESLTNDLMWELQTIAEHHNIDISKAPSLQSKFKLLITQMGSIERVVILVDEYDYPILTNIQDVERATACRNILRDFFGVIKDLDDYIRFVFITGVSKFSKTSLFSGLNNLEDLTLSDKAMHLSGYTGEEIKLVFEPYLKQVAEQTKTSIS